MARLCAETGVSTLSRGVVQRRAPDRGSGGLVHSQHPEREGCDVAPWHQPFTRKHHFNDFVGHSTFDREYAMEQNGQDNDFLSPMAT